jgi:hypothetical protein
MSSLDRNVPYLSTIEVSPVVCRHENRRRGGGNVESSLHLRAFQGRRETVENRAGGKFLPTFAPRPVFHSASSARHFHGLQLLAHISGSSSPFSYSDSLCAMDVLEAVASA